MHERENYGQTSRNKFTCASFYKNLRLFKKNKGHLSAVNCMQFDQSGKYILTGANDFTIKLWSVTNGSLLGTFLGASSEITDIAVNSDHMLLAASSRDRTISVWDFKEMTQVRKIYFITETLQFTYKQ